MGAIVSTKEDITDNDCASPSAVTAAQAKIRHELLKEHFKFAPPDQVNKGGGREEEGKLRDKADPKWYPADPKWFPAGVSPRLFATGEEEVGVVEAQEVQMDWMDSHYVSTRELHEAAALIRRGRISRTGELSLTLQQNDEDEQPDNSDLPSPSLLAHNGYYIIQSSLHDEALSPPQSTTLPNESPSLATPLSEPSATPLSEPSAVSTTSTPLEAVTPNYKPATPLNIPPLQDSLDTIHENQQDLTVHGNQQDTGAIDVVQAAEVPVVGYSDLETGSETGNETGSRMGKAASKNEKSLPVHMRVRDDTKLPTAHVTSSKVSEPVDSPVVVEVNRLQICPPNNQWEAPVTELSSQQKSKRASMSKIQHLKPNNSQRRKSHDSTTRPTKKALKTVNFTPTDLLPYSHPSTPTSAHSPHPFISVQPRAYSSTTLSTTKTSRKQPQAEKREGRKKPQINPFLTVTSNTHPSSPSSSLTPQGVKQYFISNPDQSSNTKTQEPDSRKVASKNVLKTEPEVKAERPPSQRKPSAMSRSNSGKISTHESGRSEEENTRSKGDLTFVMKGTVCRRKVSREESISHDEKMWSQVSSMVDMKEGSGETTVNEAKVSSLVMSLVNNMEEMEEEGQDEEEVATKSASDSKKNVDSLVNLLYSEIAETLEEQSEGQVKKSGVAQDSEVTLLPDVLQKIHTAVVIEGMQKRSREPDYGENSILIAPPDNKTLMKAGEFRSEAVKHLHNLTSSIKLDYYRFLSDYDQTFFYAAQQLEAGLPNYTPQTLLLISSTIPKNSILRATVLPHVLVHIYDFHHGTAEHLLDKIEEILSSYMPKAKAKYLGIVCKGGPGHFYLMKNMPVTPAKIRNNVQLLEFWQKLGSHMSKLYPGQSIIHLMESNVAGNKQGEQLLTDLEYAMFSHQVKVKSPLELAPSGRAMLGLYFNTAQHKLWKATRYSKLRLYKVKSPEI